VHYFLFVTRYGSANRIIIGHIQVFLIIIGNIQVRVKVRVRVGVGVRFRVRVSLISYNHTATAMRRKKMWIEHDLTGNSHPDVSNYNPVSRCIRRPR
jgi:hypothetical protein